MEEIKDGRVDYISGEKEPKYGDARGSEEGLVVENIDGLKRRLTGRQMQMITIGGSIGTALFVSIGSGLVQGGPGSLFIAFTVYCCFLALVNNCMAEMAVFMPVSGSFVRMGSKWVDEAFGFMLGWNFFLYEVSGPRYSQYLIPISSMGPGAGNLIPERPIPGLALRLPALSPSVCTNSVRILKHLPSIIGLYSINVSCRVRY